MQKVDVKSIFRPSLFWDADEIDADKHAAYVIARVLCEFYGTFVQKVLDPFFCKERAYSALD